MRLRKTKVFRSVSGADAETDSDESVACVEGGKTLGFGSDGGDEGTLMVRERADARASETRAVSEGRCIVLVAAMSCRGFVSSGAGDAVQCCVRR